MQAQSPGKKTSLSEGLRRKEDHPQDTGAVSMETGMLQAGEETLYPGGEAEELDGFPHS